MDKKREIKEMKIIYEYSHLGGYEILKVHYPEILQDIYNVIAQVNVGKTKMSKEKTNAGEMLYSPVEMNGQFKTFFSEKGYSEIRDYYDLVLPGKTEIVTPGTFKQIDFHKDNILIEVQFGKYAFMFYDVAKFQYFFNENKARVGVEIVPCHHLQHQMSSGVSYGEQLVYDIERLRRHFPAVPVMVILIDMDE